MFSNELVRYSRAGDVFHYRWAARRCLDMIYPNSALQYVIIEGSQEKKKSGEYVIDVSEYYANSSDRTQIKYYQLKHTTIHKDDPFTLSDIESTIKGFADRFRSLSKDKSYKNKEITYIIVTNRPFSPSLIANIQKVICRTSVSKRFIATLESYTQLNGDQLIEFCKALVFVDDEGDYQYQRLLLQQKTAELTANPSSASVISSIIELVQEKALPDNEGKIVPQDILLKFGITSGYDLFPAPSRIEYIKDPIPRKVYTRIIEEVYSVQEPSIIHASGGVGKTVCATYIMRSLPDESVAILYDCFGAGSYRNRSTPRHKHYDALVQIINELALQDLCEPLIADNNISSAKLLRAFQQRVETVCFKLQQVNNHAKFVLIIDAADNAELAAQEFAERCFVHELLMENYPQTFKLIMLCRTERLELVDPERRAHHIELSCFDIEESKQHLLSFYPDATNDDTLEFHRLTCANPRVQINVLSAGHNSIQQLLVSLGIGSMTVDKQIQNQLLFALENVKRKESKIVQQSIDNVCVGLATLPPFIPVEILSKAASVSEAMIKSLVADIGRPLWLVDNYAVQFRDEPTETWFKNTYAATKEQIQAYISHLRPFAASNVYISEALPSLYIQADMYDELVRLALSEEELPLSNPTIARNIRVYRLQFALKAALKLEQYSDTVKLALIAGEETAGKTRQMELLSKNIDLIRTLQSNDEIQSLAYRRTLRGNWNGSENLYSASLLSIASRLTGEARNFLRAAFEWLKIYFRQAKQEEFSHNTLTDEEIGEFAHAINNIRGTEDAVSFLCEYFVQSPRFAKIMGLFVKRLVDSGDNRTINNIMMLEIRNVFFLVALSHELIRVGKFPPANQLEIGLMLLIASKTRPKKISYYNDAEYYLDGLISFLEACAKQGLSKQKILRALAIHFDSRATRNFTDNWYRNERAAFLRVVALKGKLTNIQSQVNDLVPLKWLDSKNKHNNESKVNDFKANYDSLFPWYQLRVNQLLGDVDNFVTECDTTHIATNKIQRWRFQDYDPIPYETFHIKVSIMSLCGELTEDEIRCYFCNYLYGSNNARTDDLLELVRISYHIAACHPIAIQAEVGARDRIVDNSDVEIDTETKLNNLISLARAVYINSSEDAAAYFNRAVELASRFGDEIVQRWDAVTALAKRTYRAGYYNDNLAYRYIRCAELVGDNVAREKYWNRNEAISTCVNLSPSTAIAALSRWRDREVGRFYLQIHALAYELVLNKHSSPMEVWPLTAFYEGYYYIDLVTLCIDSAVEHGDKQFILKSAIHAMQIAECCNQDWIKLKNIAHRYSLANEELEYIINAYSNAEGIPTTEKDDSSSRLESIASVFDGVDLVSQDGIREIYRRHKLIDRHIRRDFREEFFIRIPQRRLTQFLHLYLDSECVDIYDAVAILEKAKNNYNDKYSLQREWDKYLYKFGYRFPYSLVSYRSFDYFTQRIARNDHERQLIKNAVIRGFADHGTFTEADTCFGFVANVVEFISHEQAQELLDYSLNRFELFIDDDFGDGPYENNMLSTEIVANSIAGFIWCALGSPHSATRWRAAHSVRFLADTKSYNVFNSLVSLLQSDSVGVYGYSGYPFYKMHAKLYLLIALLRIAVDDASLIYPHRQQIEELFSTSNPHILMQKISAEICIAIETQYPNTYKKEEIKRLQAISQSPFPVEDKLGSNYKNSYLHQSNSFSVPEDYHHSFFFEEDWFKPLGMVFGIRSKQVTELATDVLINDWRYPYSDEYERDPRDFQWQRGSLTHHSHGTYPRSDDYRFYLSYHAMLGVASKLLKHMPSVRRFEDEDPWEYWFAQHYLTRNDGRWISDRRDPAPLRQHDFDSMKTDWETSISEEMIFGGLCNENFYGSFTTVYGWWEDGNSSLSETYHVSSAFIPVDTTEALVYALCSFESPHDYRLPTYNEECDDDENPVLDETFSMVGWIVDSDCSKRIDEYDPFAADISYPPYQFGEFYANMMNLSADSEHRFWQDKYSGQIKALCETWCSDVENPMRDTALRKGMKISLDYQAIVQLCKQLNKNLLVEVTLKHSLKREHYGYEKSREYRPPEARLYVICKDGTVKQSASIGRSHSKKSE